MDYKIRDIELASFYLAWQHTAFYKPRDSAASFRIGRNRETITRSDDPPPPPRRIPLRRSMYLSGQQILCLITKSAALFIMPTP